MAYNEALGERIRQGLARKKGIEGRRTASRYTRSGPQGRFGHHTDMPPLTSITAPLT